MKKLLIIFCLISVFGHAQDTKNALFLGNSYTYYNDLPKLIEDIAKSKGDIFNHDKYTPGGKSLFDHASDITSLNKIKNGEWDYVILQDQSQKPAFNPAFVSANCLPYAKQLSDSVYKYNPCGKPLFFMTWGRKNGDASNCASYPPICTYEGMQARLRSSYLIMGNQNNAPVAAVGAVWRDLRTANPNINLYSSDESHPSLNGSYLAACTFYASIFHKSPVGAWKPTTMDSTNARLIQIQAQSTVFDSLLVWRIDTSFALNNTGYEPTGTIGTQNEFSFYALDSLCLDSVKWDFGNGTTSSGFSVIGNYTAPGIYNVVSKHYKNLKTSLDTIELNILPNSIKVEDFPSLNIYPNPTQSILNIESDIFQNATYFIQSLDGKKLMNGRIENNQISINELKRGCYLLNIEIDGINYKEKFVKPY